MPIIEGLRKKLVEKARERVREKFSDPLAHIARAVNALDELDRVFNQVSEQVIEWYAIHFPELSRIVNDNEKFLELVVSIGERKGFQKNAVEKVLHGDEKSELIESRAVSSMGSGIPAEALAEIQGISKTALLLRQQRKSLVAFIESHVIKHCAHFSSACPPLLAARLINEAGSLEKLAFIPSSAIQVLGAKKALFRHMRSGARSPKHGLIFQHPLVQSAQQKQRGKAARKLAGKISIAVKQDYFGESSQQA